VGYSTNEATTGNSPTSVSLSAAEQLKQLNIFLVLGERTPRLRQRGGHSVLQAAATGTGTATTASL
jgi:hypothetical protein